MGINEQFYNKKIFDNLIEPPIFKEYLGLEKEKLKNIIKGGSLLDVGCGYGRLFPILSDLTDHIVAIDLSQNLCRLALKLSNSYPNIDVICGDILQNNSIKNKFDYILFAWNTFGNFYSDRDLALRKVKEMLKPDGKIILSVLSEQSIESYFEMLSLNNLGVIKFDDDYVYLNEGLISERFSRKKLEFILKEHDLVGNIERISPIAYMVVAGLK